MGIKGTAKAGPAAKRAGRRAALNIAHVVELRALIAEHRHASLDQVSRELDRRTGVQVCTATVRKALRAAGVTRVTRVKPIATAWVWLAEPRILATRLAA